MVLNQLTRHLCFTEEPELEALCLYYTSPTYKYITRETFLVLEIMCV